MSKYKALIPTTSTILEYTSNEDKRAPNGVFKMCPTGH